ncbi:MAG: hypothetical protein OQK24_00175 [Magnetovibrio sp.]|nr:hypothetical protein [Magnetovibrio sp.]
MLNILFLFKKSATAVVVLWILYLLLTLEILGPEFNQLLVAQLFILIFFVLIETYGFIKAWNKQKSK